MGVARGQECLQRLRGSLLLLLYYVGKCLEVRARCVDYANARLTDSTHNAGGKGITLQLEQHALAGRDLRTSLAHSLECPRHLLFVAARYPIGKYVHVIPVLEQV
jgi:hypothetical protein